ncbi:hypothetical protein P389DRAFT_67759 [Cystobasidium minutum MCA 4210]|uniref:uncharacterized protein n=1 Tax=Cystobasidium minutum MCA 4210 TaxID=1397322 RepID=UPI0034CDA43E|eukprot:jgi/Rhomi1/67759/CE67758_1477
MSMSQSPDGFDEDLSDFDDFENPPPSAKRAKKGKASSKGKSKAGSNNNNNNPLYDEGNDTASARKLQNRVAQREFRQRKLQYVKDLEARVEFLSSSKDDQLEALKAMLRGLLDENKQLRHMLQTVTNFVGDGIGGLSHKAGLKDYGDIDNFMEFVHRGDRKTLLAHYDTWKESKAAASGGGNAGASESAANLDTPDGEQSSAPPSKGKNGNTNKEGTGKRSQPSSRATSPVNNSSTNEGGLSRKRSRNDKSNSTPAATSKAPTSQDSATSAVKQENSSAPNSANPPSNPFDPSAHSSAANNARTPAFPSIISNPPPADYAAYLNYMNSSMPNTNASTSYNPPYYSQLPNSNGPQNTTYNTFSNYGNGMSGWPGRFGDQFPGNNNNNSNTGAGAGGSNAFFFDTAEPMSMPTSSFTNDFINQYIHTGLTPLIDPTFQNTSMFPWSMNSSDGNAHSAPTPSSSTSSMHQMPSPINQNNNNSNNQSSANNNNNQNRNSNQLSTMQSQQQQQLGNFVQPLSLGQSQQQQQQTPSLPPQLYNPLASPSLSLPSIPPGFSPDELINSNPLLAAIHIISFHLRNKAADPNYKLPTALEPTPQQGSTPHDRRLDGILHREWRTRLLSKLDYNINELLQDLMQAATVHPGDNLLDPANWELSETFLRKYKHTITPDVLSDSNKWRRSRGDAEITL